jgi:hypothetical protein
MWFSKPKNVPFSVDNILTLTLPKSFTSVGTVRENMQRTIYQFREHQTTDWGAYPQYPVILQVVVFNPDAPSSDQVQSLADSFSLLAANLVIAERSAERSTVEWTESGGTKVGSVGYKKNLTEEPAWVVTATGNGFAVDFYAWKKKYSEKQAKALVEQAVGSIQLKNLKQHWADIADQPRRAKEAREAKLARINAMLEAAGWPAAEPAGKVIEHEGFVYAASADRAAFGVGLKLGEIKSNGHRTFEPRAESLLSREEEEQLPSVWYSPEDREWQILDRESRWTPTKELLAFLRNRFVEEDTVYFYAMRGFAFEYADIGDFEVTVFAERAKRLREMFQAGKVARLR